MRRWRTWSHLGWESNTNYTVESAKSWGENWARGCKSQGTPPSVWNTGMYQALSFIGPRNEAKDSSVIHYCDDVLISNYTTSGLGKMSSSVNTWRRVWPTAYKLESYLKYAQWDSYPRLWLHFGISLLPTGQLLLNWKQYSQGTCVCVCVCVCVYAFIYERGEKERI